MNATVGPYFGKRRSVWADMTHAWKLEVIDANHAEALQLDAERRPSVATGLASTHQDVPKQACRDLIAQLAAYLPGRVSAMPIWMDGAWKDYWYVTLDGQEVGEIHYDSFGPVVKGDALGTLVYQASA